VEWKNRGTEYGERSVRIGFVAVRTPGALSIGASTNLIDNETRQLYGEAGLYDRIEKKLREKVGERRV
jgi:hypothetical protein